MSKTCGSHTHTYRYAHLTKLKPQIHKRKPLNRTEWFWFLFLLSWKINFKLSHSLAMQDKIKEKFIKISISHTRSDDVSFKFSDRLNVNIICVDFIMCRGPIKIHWPINLKDDKKKRWIPFDAHNLIWSHTFLTGCCFFLSSLNSKWFSQQNSTFLWNGLNSHNNLIVK